MTAGAGVENPFRYRGYVWDAETELYYLGSRYYDAEVGRFLNPDDTETFWLDQESFLPLNLYAYCWNNPVNMSDDSGNFPFFIATGIGAAVVGGVIGFVKTKSWKGAVAGAAIGGAVGLAVGAGAAFLLAGKATASTGAVAIGARLQLAGAGTKGFSSLRNVKKVQGVAGKGKAWHHIVEESTANINKFGVEKVHKLNNLVKISHGKGTLHNMISSHYSSKFEFTDNLTVRKWLQSKSFRFQYNYGLEILAKYSKEMKSIIEYGNRFIE